MNRAFAVLISAIVFTMIGLLTGYLIIAQVPQLPHGPDDNNRMWIVPLVILGMGSMVGTIVGLIVGVIAALFWPRADRPDAPGAKDLDATQPYAKQ